MLSSYFFPTNANPSPMSFKKINISKDCPITHYNENGILFMNLFDFLLDINSLNK